MKKRCEEQLKVATDSSTGVTEMLAKAMKMAGEGRGVWWRGKILGIARRCRGCGQ